MTKVRFGVIGLGNIGERHAACLAEGKTNGAELVAVARAAPDRLKRFAATRVFPGGDELIRSGLVDAVIIATPHFQHTLLGIAALERGLHVLVEKPISAHKADAERLLAAHRKNPGLVFAGMFQLRVEPRYAKIRELIRGGELGDVARASWIITDWFRTEAYYASGGWRATWKGEGGGVLLNQCLHNLDAWQWLLGMPARVRGFCQLGRFHRIEVEDNVSAYFEYPDGATGMFVSSTGEAPGTNRLEIAGTRGKLVLEHNTLTFERNAVDMIQFSKTAALGFARPEVSQVQIPFTDAADPHAAIIQNFVNAILLGEPLIAPAAEGIHSLELANAILYSSLARQTIALPLDSAAYERKLSQLIAESTTEKKGTCPTREDVARSFQR